MDQNFNYDNMQPKGNERNFSNQFAQYHQAQPQQPVQPGYNQTQPQQPAYNQYQQPYDYNAANPSVYNAPANEPTGAAKAFSIVSLICGILSMITCCFGIEFGIPGLVFALIAMAKFKGKNTMAQLGLVFSIVGIVLSTGCFIVWIIFLL